MALSRFEATVVLGLGCAVVMSSSTAHAHDPGATIYGLWAPPGGHATLMPAYASIIYYAVKKDKQMPLGWMVPNLINSAGAAALGTLMIIATGADADAPQPWIVGNGAVLIAGGLGVTVASILQRYRDERGVQGSLVFLPMARVHSGAPLGGVMALGSF